MVAYYEQDDAQPPGAIVAALAGVIRVSTDELLGLTTEPAPVSLRVSRLRRQLQTVEELAPEDQRAVLKFIDGLKARTKLNELQKTESKKRRAA